MPESVKPRSYNSPLREQRAQQTRKAILDAAERLFIADGYVRTRLPDVAAEAGVSLATVKLVFGTKTNLLLDLWHRTLAGGVDDQIPVADRDWSRKQYEIDDPVEKLRIAAANGVMVKQRIATLFQVIETAGVVDPEIAELWSRMGSEFYANVRRLVEDLRKRGQLRPGLSVGQATDVMWTLNHPRTYLLLVHERGWSPKRYQKWLAEAMERELL